MKYALHIVSALLFVCFSLTAVAEEDGPQRSMKIKDQSYMRYADGGDPVEYFSTELYFDPSIIEKSTFMLAGRFFPAMESDPEGYKRTGTFKADSIQKVDGHSFQATGVLASVNGNQNVKSVFTVSFDKTSEQPLLVFDGALVINMTSHASSPRFVNKNPNEVVVEFHIVAKPLPR